MLNSFEVQRTLKGLTFGFDTWLCARCVVRQGFFGLTEEWCEP